MDSVIDFLRFTFTTNIIKTFPFAMLASSAVSVGLVLYLSRGRVTFRFADILTGITLILIAMLYAGLIGSIANGLPGEDRGNYDLVYWIIPFYSAAIGSNFISNAFLGQRTYIEWDKSHSNRCWDGVLLLAIVASVFFPPLLLIVFIAIAKRYRKSRELPKAKISAP